MKETIYEINYWNIKEAEEFAKRWQDRGYKTEIKLNKNGCCVYVYERD